MMQWQDEGRGWSRALTPREREVMDLLVEGRANKVIADRLGISIRTVEVHRARVLSKMGARNVVELVWRLHAQRLAALGGFAGEYRCAEVDAPPGGAVARDDGAEPGA